LLGFEPSTSWLSKPSHCGVLSKQLGANWRRICEGQVVLCSEAKRVAELWRQFLGVLLHLF
jgi:hypothetical protein